MATTFRNTGDDAVVASTCENPQFPNWAWRYNRNKHLSRFGPWQIREERMPPNYRNMGVHSNFRFHPLSPDEVPRPFQTLGVNFCHDVNLDRVAGFGNSAIGRTPGPAPPRLILYNVQAPYQYDDLYKVNEIHNITPGLSLLGPRSLGAVEDEQRAVPLNPSHYLDQTLSQRVQIPGTFPHFNKPLPTMSHKPPLQCRQSRDEPRDLMEIWKQNFAGQLAGHARERRNYCCSGTSLPTIAVKDRRHCSA